MKILPFRQTGDPDRPVENNPEYLKKHNLIWKLSETTDQELRQVISLINLFPHFGNFLFKEIRDALLIFLTHDITIKDVNESRYWQAIVKMVAKFRFDFFNINDQPLSCYFQKQKELITTLAA